MYEMAYGPTICSTKLSLLLLYLRIFSPNRYVRYAIYIGMIANVIFYGTITVVFGVLCIPRPGFGWLQTVQTARCRRSIDMDYPTGIFGVISDFYILIVPIPIVVKLNLSVKKKIGIVAIFMTGIL